MIPTTTTAVLKASGSVQEIENIHFKLYFSAKTRFLLLLVWDVDFKKTPFAGLVCLSRTLLCPQLLSVSFNALAVGKTPELSYIQLLFASKIESNSGETMGGNVHINNTHFNCYVVFKSRCSLADRPFSSSLKTKALEIFTSKLHLH